MKLNRNNITMAAKLGGIGNMVIGAPPQMSTPDQAYKDDFTKSLPVKDMHRDSFYNPDAKRESFYRQKPIMSTEPST